MKITKVEIFGFGKFKDKTIELNTSSHLIFGGNEAGKSSLYNFIKYIFFGIEKGTKTRRDFKPKNTPSLYGGRITFDTVDHKQVMLTRLNNQKDGIKANVPLVQLPSGLTGQDQLLHDLIKPLTKALFSDVYSFQQEQLADLNKLSTQELQETLMSIASSGSQRLFQEKAALMNQNRELFTKNGNKPAINQTMNKLLEIDQVISEKEKHESRYHAASQRLLDLEQHVIDKKHIREELLDLRQQCLNQIEHFDTYDKYKELLTLYTKENIKNSTPLTSDVDCLTKYYQEWLTLQNEIKYIKKQQDHSEEALLHEGSQAFVFYQKNKEQLTEIIEAYPLVTEIKGKLTVAKGRLLATNTQIDDLQKQWGFDPSLPPKEILEQERDEIRQINHKFEALALEEEQLIEDINHLYRTNSFLQQQLIEKESNTVATVPIENNHNKSLFFVLSSLSLAIIIFVSTTGSVRQVSLLLLLIISLIISVVLRKKHRKSKNKDELFSKEEHTLTNNLLDNQHKIKTLEEQQKLLPNKKQALSLEMSRFVQRLNLGNLDNLIDVIRFSDKPQEFNHLLAEKNRLVDNIATLESELIAYQQKAKLAQDWVPLANLDVINQLEAITEFSHSMEKYERENANVTLSTINERLRVNDCQQKELSERAAPYLKKYDLDHLTAVPTFLEKNKKLNLMQEKIAYYTEILTPVFDLEDQIDKKNIHASLTILNQKLTLLKEEIDADHYQETQLKASVDDLIRNGTLAEAYQKRSLLMNELTELASQWLSNKLEDQLFSELILEMSDQTLPQLLEKTSTYLSLLTSHNYSKIELLEDDTLSIINKDGMAFRPLDLSTGTKDQLFMALRLAFITSKTPSSSPIIIDDGWLHYDNERKNNLLDLLNKEVAPFYQIIILTSDTAIYDYYHKNRLAITTLD